MNLAGKKTYIVAIATVIYAVLGLILGYQSSEIAVPLILGALGLAGLRIGIGNNK